ncbi:MAG: TolC family protein [Holosporaceae bacterium]|jgi:outer membrane protein|nr:TolC family protein [Holosporaceae bacterium]
MRIYSFWFFLFCYGTGATTFEEAVVAAYNSNKEWFVNQTEKRIVDETLTQSKMLFLPNVYGKVSSSRIKSEAVQTSDGSYPIAIQGNQLIYGDVTTTARSSSKETDTSMEIGVSQNLFNGFSTVNRVMASKNYAKAAYHKLRFEEQQLIINVLNTYTSIWVGRQKVVALKKKEENLKKALDSKDSSLEAGMGTPSEVAQASANYQKAIYERIEAETELFSAESEFEKLTGLKADKNIELPDLKFQLPENLDKLIGLAMSSNHNIKYKKFEEQAEVSNLNAARGNLSPTCDLSLRAIRSLRKQKYNNSNNNYVASLEVNVPIFSNSPSSGNTYSSIAIANQKALKARFSAEDIILETKKECVVYWNKYISANAMIKSSRSAVKSAELSSESNLEENAMGMKSNTEVLVEENQLLEARINLANSRKQKMLSAVVIYALTGNLSLNSVLKKK